MKTINEIEYCHMNDIKNGDVDIAFIIDGVDLIDMDKNKALTILKNNDMIKDEMIIIPAGLDVTKKECDGAVEYNFGNDHIIVDLAFDDDDDEKNFIQ